MKDFRSFYQGKRVLVTGHTGFKGAWLCEWLLSMGAKVSGISLNVPTQPSLYECLRLNDRVSGHELDLGDEKATAQVLKKVDPEIIFHLAAQPLVRESYDTPVSTFRTNIMGTIHLLEACRSLSSVRSIVIVTSDKVYENTGSYSGYRETDRLGGKDPYSASKACVEIATSSYIHSFFSQNSTISIGRARAGNVIGGGDWAKDRIFPDCVKAWSKGQNVLIRSPLAVRPWQHVVEPIGGYLLLGQMLFQNEPHTSKEAFNFGPDTQSSLPVEKIVRKCAEFWPGIHFTIGERTESNDKPEAHFLQINCDKAFHLLGWRPHLSVNEAIEWTVRWYRAYLEDPQSVRALTKEQIKNYEEKVF